MSQQTVDRVGVHATHCCKEHGCKYCDDDCPVVLCTVEQVYPCEDCHHDNAKLNAGMKKAVELGVMVDTPDNRAVLKEVLNAADAYQDTESPW